MLILRLTGKAKEVFRYLASLAEKQGTLTLGEISKVSKGELQAKGVIR